MTENPTVAVRGEAVREVEPELAQLTVTVAARDSDRERTLRRLAERAEALRRLLDGYAESIERRETSGVHVHPETRKGSGERVRAYTGSVSTTVTFSDFSDLGEVVLTLADQDQTSVYGPYWSLRPDSPAYREARRAAIADALGRAREYADALGARLVRLVELTDSGLGGEHGPQPMMMAARAELGGSPQLELDPARQTVRAAVEARFAISEPTVLG
ncbi:MAG TPA: SIMPL domain-containing protein [Planosporangium sp.]|jgi:uncharacterized protein YggE|nr:SIMPL domain-containing protein [Planosporangium sp.]